MAFKRIEESEKVLGEGIKKLPKAWKDTRRELTTRVIARPVRNLQRLQPQATYSKSQQMFQEMFQGERTWGTGQNLPVINGTLMPNKVGGDLNDTTASTFGFGRAKFKTPLF